ncbi:biotin-dependent carboxyltransferase family protein [Phyllobacterium zundukense]|uniref:Allophanate hydrolase n=1 Tax=Phyllobacterium zundukense TaxID=1867719 RepID=A0A2N9VV11_9HYPH|nr:biotin-dependent carboxyltransferase family protein [Phyllobacterium zundukense]ATU94634.1 allophanate hydrolase [Phyllobacterium zundukense]PIO43329.1 allophanate hydrolase [Phyllobacterium zundukense]
MIEIVDAGPLNTIQDLGRPGYRDIGVTASGAMDPLALKIANLLVGNDQGAAGIEVQTFPFRLRFRETTVFAVTGGANAKIEGVVLPPWWMQTGDAGQVLELLPSPVAARAYIAFAGGVDVPIVMGSRSTSLRGAFGGIDGRFLQKGDSLLLGESLATALPADGLGVVPPAIALAEFFPVAPDSTLLIRALPAGEYDLFGADGERFWSQSWKISSQSDRTGYRLSGEPVRPTESVEMRSYGIVPGVVQVPPGGEPIVQMSDANTAGGYPKIAGVLDADLWRLGQARIGSRLRFVRSSHAEARTLDKAVAAYVDDVRNTSQMVGRALKTMAGPQRVVREGKHQ